MKHCQTQIHPGFHIVLYCIFYSRQNLMCIVEASSTAFKIVVMILISYIFVYLPFHNVYKIKCHHFTLSFNCLFFVTSTCCSILPQECPQGFWLCGTFSHHKKEESCLHTHTHFACLTLRITNIIITWQWRAHVVTKLLLPPWCHRTPVNHTATPTWWRGHTLPHKLTRTAS